MESERLNLPTTFSMKLEVMGHELEFSQDPNSKHLGTTVWDASLVFAKFLERNCRRGRFSPSKLKGKRVIELGAGCGVAGFGMALLGCDVVMTDQTEVLPLLQRNVERNTSRIKQLNPDSFGSIKVAELSWGNDDNIRACAPPFDYIIGTDVVYAEHLLEPLLQTIFALSGPKTTIMVGYEIRSTSVHEQMMDMWKKNFEVKTVPSSKMDETYQHPSIQLYIMGMKPQLGTRTTESTSKAIDQISDGVETIQDDENEVGCNEVENPGTGITENLAKRIGRTIDQVERNPDKDEVGGRCDKVGEAAEVVGEKAEEGEIIEMRLPKPQLSEWEARRYGSVAARLLQDIKITNS